MLKINFKTSIFSLVAVLVGAQAYGQVAVRARVRENIKTREAVETPSAKAGDATVSDWKSSSALNKTTKTAVAPSVNKETNSCDPNGTATDLMKDTKVSFGDALRAEKYLNLAGTACGKDIVALSPEPKENLIKIANEEANCLNDASPVNNPMRTGCLIKAHETVLSLDESAATTNVKTIDSNCHYSL